LAFLANIAPTFWIIAHNLKSRDFRYVIPFLGFCWFSLGCMSHPVGLGSSAIPEERPLLYSLNPMVNGRRFRWCILGGQPHSICPI
jgi:lipopolysaccharide transport system permease protein